MSDQNLACIILAAGKGTRMKSDLPKAMHKIAGLPMINWLLKSVEALHPSKIIVVGGEDAHDLAEAVKPHQFVIQKEAKGTANAVKAALPALAGFDGNVLILLADMPFISIGIMEGLIEEKRQEENSALTVLGIDFDCDPPPFGRLVVNEENNTLEAIVEHMDCTPEQKQITLCNSGVFCVNGANLSDWVNRVGNENAQGEYYITDLPEIAFEDGMKSHVCVLRDTEDLAGVNSRADLAVAENLVQQTLRQKAMKNGATLLDPESVYFSHDTMLGCDVVIEPNVFFGPGVKVADHVQIKSFSHIEHATIKEGAIIGPFARLRPGAEIGEDAKIGNFVEIKNATLGIGVKVSHLAYVGDAVVGAGTNFSCGAITANYDGFEKHKTIIGENVMVGCNVNLVAPVEIGDGAFLAAGSTITKDVPLDSLAVVRGKLIVREGWAASNRITESRRKTA